MNYGAYTYEGVKGLTIDLERSQDRLYNERSGPRGPWSSLWKTPSWKK